MSAGRIAVVSPGTMQVPQSVPGAYCLCLQQGQGPASDETGVSGQDRPIGVGLRDVERSPTPPAGAAGLFPAGLDITCYEDRMP